MRIFGVTGWKNAGKTTLVIGLVAELVSRGVKVATLKHAHHNFDTDKEGTDSFRHRAAGACEVLVSSANRWAMIHELEGRVEPDLGDLLAKFASPDIVIIEGYKTSRHPKLEVAAPGQTEKLIVFSDKTILAVAADHQISGLDLPVYRRDDIVKIADLVQEKAQPFCNL